MNCGAAVKTWISYLILGPLVFWGSGMILRAVASPPSSELRNVVPPLSLCVTYGIARKLRGSSPGPSLALCMLIGIFLLGPWFMVFTKTLLTGGFHSVRTWKDVHPLAVSSAVLILFAVQPLFTVKMSLDDGSLGALLFATLFLIAAHFVSERHHWILPFFRQAQK